MTIQTTYADTLTPAKAGQLASPQASWVKHFTAEGAIGFGRGVIKGTGDHQVLLAAADGVLLGVAVADSQGNEGLDAGYAALERVPVIQFGQVWGHVVGAFTIGAPAYVITTVGATQGQFTATPNALGQIGKFASSGSGTLAVIDVSLAIQGEQGPAGTPG
jgi:hypothetical protein